MWRTEEITRTVNFRHWFIFVRFCRLFLPPSLAVIRIAHHPMRTNYVTWPSTGQSRGVDLVSHVDQKFNTKFDSSGRVKNTWHTITLPPPAFPSPPGVAYRSHHLAPKQSRKTSQPTCSSLTANVNIFNLVQILSCHGSHGDSVLSYLWRSCVRGWVEPVWESTLYWVRLT